MENWGSVVQWCLLIIAVGGIIYNAIVSRAIIQNEICHIKKMLEKLEKRIERIEEWLWKK